MVALCERVKDGYKEFPRYRLRNARNFHDTVDVNIKVRFVGQPYSEGAMGDIALIPIVTLLLLYHVYSDSEN